MVILRLVSALAFVAVFLVHHGVVNVPMPYPAVNTYITSPPAEDVPPDPRPMTGPFAPNDRLHNATKLFVGEVLGAETVVVAKNGTIFLPDKFGHIWAAAASGAAGAAAAEYVLSRQPVSRLGNGRPLGAHMDHDGNIIVCDSLKGLLQLDQADPRRITLLAAAVSDDSPKDPGSVINYANDLDIAADGKVYFTASQDILPALNKEGFWDTFRSYMLGMYSGHAKGRLLVYDPATRSTHVIATGFYYANGVALAADESFVLVVETVHRRVWRVWLQGPEAFKRELFVDNVPGFPDGVSRASDGGFWLAVVAPLSPLLKLLRSRLVTGLLSWVPLTSWPTILGLKNPATIKPWGCVAKLSPDGQVEYTLQDPDGSHVAFVSGVTQQGNRLWLGNIKLDYISYIDL